MIERKIEFANSTASPSNLKKQRWLNLNAAKTKERVKPFPLFEDGRSPSQMKGSGGPLCLRGSFGSSQMKERFALLCFKTDPKGGFAANHLFQRGFAPSKMKDSLGPLFEDGSVLLPSQIGPALTQAQLSCGKKGLTLLYRNPIWKKERSLSVSFKGASLLRSSQSSLRSKLLISDHIYQHNQSYLFWILGLFYGSLSLNGLSAVGFKKSAGGVLKTAKPLSTKEIKIRRGKAPLNGVLWTLFRNSIETCVPQVQSQLVSFKLINLFYNIHPFFLNYFYHIDYTNIFHTYWFSGFLESNLNYLAVYFNKFTSPHLTYKQLLQKSLDKKLKAFSSLIHSACQSSNYELRFAPSFPVLDSIWKEGIRRKKGFHPFFLLTKELRSFVIPFKEREGVNPLCFQTEALLPSESGNPLLFTSIIFEFHLFDKNYYNLLIINKFFKGKIVLINHNYKLILKFPFGINQILLIIQYLNNYPFLTSKFLKYYKLRKIYKICQKKENYYHKGIIPISKEV